MTFETILDELKFRLVNKLSKEFDADLWGCIDGSLIEVTGHCRKVHPDLVSVYPNGWTLLHAYTVDQALEKLNLTLELKEKS